MANSDFKELLHLFEACDVTYLVVGGYAVMYYCEPRYTKDPDIWIDASPDNARNVYGALARLETVTAEEYAPARYSPSWTTSRERERYQVVYGARILTNVGMP